MAVEIAFDNSGRPRASPAPQGRSDPAGEASCSRARPMFSSSPPDREKNLAPLVNLYLTDRPISKYTAYGALRSAP